MNHIMSIAGVSQYSMLQNVMVNLTQLFLSFVYSRKKDKERSEQKLKERLEERKKRHQGDAPDNPVIVDMEKHDQ